jgi:hypothetical protein
LNLVSIMNDLITRYVKDGPVKNRLLVFDEALSKYEHYWSMKHAPVTNPLIKGMEGLFTDVVEAFVDEELAKNVMTSSKLSFFLKYDKDAKAISISKMYWALENIKSSNLKKIMKLPSPKCESYFDMLEAREKAIKAWEWLAEKFDTNKFKEIISTSSYESLGKIYVENYKSLIN